MCELFVLTDERKRPCGHRDDDTAETAQGTEVNTHSIFRAQDSGPAVGGDPDQPFGTVKSLVKAPVGLLDARAHPGLCPAYEIGGEDGQHEVLIFAQSYCASQIAPRQLMNSRALSSLVKPAKNR